jgi:hypothetical protein
VAKKGAASTEEWLESAGKPDPKVAALEEENRRLSKLLGLVEAYHAAAGEPPEWLRPGKKAKPGRATACMILSDLHLDEQVSPGEVNGLNAYSRPIAEMRLRRWATKACEMGERHKTAYGWDGALVLLNGDLVSGGIHEELRETNADVLPGTLRHWAPLLAAALKQVADCYGRVHVPCVAGNHGRLTHKKQFKRRGRNSFDWLMAIMVQSHLKNDSRVTFDIAEGSCLFPPIYDTHIALSHGDEVSGGGGWAGVWSPTNKARRQLLEMAGTMGIRPAYAALGHWHQLVLAHHRGLVVNGSLKGPDEFSVGLRFEPEPAMQAWWVHSQTHGVVLAGPLLVSDPKAEGWR